MKKLLIFAMILSMSLSTVLAQKVKQIAKECAKVWANVSKSELNEMTLNVSQDTCQFPVKASQRYVFFSIKDAAEDIRQYVDEYTMTCSRSSETNQIYVIFSPQPFTKAVDNASEELLPRELEFEEFQKWLVKLGNKDNTINIENKLINIAK